MRTPRTETGGEMLIFLQFATIVAMIAATYVMYRALGPQRERLLYTKAEKLEWDELIGKKISSWFAATSIFGTITSLATVYVFFIGNSRLFGGWIFVTIITLIAGAFATNYITRQICARGNYADLIADNNPAASVIPAIFWSDTSSAKIVSGLVKYIIIVNIVCVLWLEFSVFSDIGDKLTGHPSIYYGGGLMLFCTFSVFYFTLRYGLRGFVFADLFQSPILILSTIALLGGSFYILLENTASFDDAFFVKLVSPQIPIDACVTFAIATIFLNGFIVVSTAPHWLRVWVFGEKESRMQIPAISLTALIWVFLIAIGLMASVLAAGNLSPANPASDALVFLLDKLIDLSPVFAMAFWLAGMAALFSTADAQMYSLLLVRQYNYRTGEIIEEPLSTIRPFLSSILLALTFFVFYIIIRISNAPFEKLVFLLLPIFMNIVPAFARHLRKLEQRPIYVYCSLGLYIRCSALALRGASQDFFFTVAAPVMPILVSIVAIRPINIILHLLNKKNRHSSV